MVTIRSVFPHPLGPAMTARRGMDGRCSCLLWSLWNSGIPLGGTTFGMVFFNRKAMGSIGVTRKIFIDSRYKVSGTDSDFVVELPKDVDCTRTSSFFLASCSLANTYSTITAGNNLFYYFIKNPAQAVILICVAPLPLGTYTPATLGVAIAAAIAPLGVQSTWAFNDGTGTYTVTWTSTFENWLFVPTYTEIDSFVTSLQALNGVSTSLVPFTRGPKYQSVNAMLNVQQHFPAPIWYTPFNTGIADLVPVREVYLHSSLANNKTLHVNGSSDAIARIPVDVGFGEMIVYRHLGPTDAISCSDVHFRTIAFQLRDWVGNLLPTGSYVVIELCFLESDPYAM